MEIKKKDYNSINEMINTFKKLDIYELECRFSTKDDSLIDYSKFENILNHLIFSKTSGGLGFTDFIEETSLDVSIKDINIRLAIDGKDNVKLYWLKNDLAIIDKYRVYKKERVSYVDINDYNMRIALSSEEEIVEKKELDNFLSKIKSDSIDKLYRLKNRYYIQTPEGIVRFDVSTVKMAIGTSMRVSNVVKSYEKYEIEMEINNRKVSVEEIQKNLFIYMNTLLMIYQDNNIIIKNNTEEIVIADYTKLVGIANKNTRNMSQLFIVANPITLDRKNLLETYQPNILSNYAITLKADGERYLLYANGKGEMYLIDSSMHVKDSGIRDELYTETLIEGEYLADKSLFLAYDILFDHGNDVRDLPLIAQNGKDRLTYLLKYVKNHKSNGVITVEEKVYKHGANIFEMSNELWSNRMNYKYDVDGLIYVPANLSYPKNAGTWDKLFKWKPEEYNSIDFLVKVEKNEKGIPIRMPYVKYDADNRIMQYKTLQLFVGKRNGNNYEAVEFNPNDDTSEKAKQINRANILLDDNERMMAIDPKNGIQMEILDDMIVEFVYNAKNKLFKWKPIRVRMDKTYKYRQGEPMYGNNDKVANNIWHNINYPITESMITTGVLPTESPNEINKPYYGCMEYVSDNRLPMQNFHNLVVKMELIKEVAGKTLLDLACGKGGDLSKWTNAGYNKVISIDINKPCIDYAKDYYQKYKAKNNKEKPNVVFILGDTSKLMFPDYDVGLTKEAVRVLKEQIPSKYMFDVVSCQFCIHYYFETETKLRQLLQNVNDNLKVGGYFIGTCFDGKRIMELLKDKKEASGMIGDKQLWTIEKRYKDARKSLYGREIEVWVSSIGEKHMEYLVEFDLLISMAKEYQLEVVKIEEFAEKYNKMNKEMAETCKMSDAEKDFSFLNNQFIFKKIGNSADTLRSKLQKKIRIKKV